MRGAVLPSPALAGEGVMRSMTDEGGAAALLSTRLRNSERPHPSRFARHLLPLRREKGGTHRFNP